MNACCSSGHPERSLQNIYTNLSVKISTKLCKDGVDEVMHMEHYQIGLKISIPTIFTNPQYHLNLKSRFKLKLRTK